MQPVIVKAYGSLHPVGESALEAVNRVLSAWYLKGAAELVGDLLRISHEGEYFPADDVVEALKPFLCDASDGKLDIIDLEAWTLRRFMFRYGRLAERTASLNHALDSCNR